LLFVNQTIKTLQNLKYYLHPDTGTTCCTCIKVTNFRQEKKIKLLKRKEKLY